MQINAANPGMSFHKLDKAKDKNLWSVRVGKHYPPDRGLPYKILDERVETISGHVSISTGRAMMPRAETPNSD